MKKTTCKNMKTAILFAVLLLFAFESQAAICEVHTATDVQTSSHAGYLSSIRSQFATLSVTGTSSCAIGTDVYFDTETNSDSSDDNDGDGFIPMYGTDVWPEKWIMFATTAYTGGDENVDKIVFESSLTINVKDFTLFGNYSYYAAKDVDDTSILVDNNNSERDAEYSIDAVNVLNNPSPWDAGSITLDFRTNFKDLEFNLDITNNDTDADGNPEATTDSANIDWSQFPLKCDSSSEPVALWNTVILLPDSFYGKNRDDSLELKKIIFDSTRPETACLVDFGANYVCIGTRKQVAGVDVDPSTVASGDMDDQNASWCDAKGDVLNWPGRDLPFIIGTAWPDVDGDGYGDNTGSISAPYMTALPDGYVRNNDDCDDSEATINPAAEEICDEIDNDCDTHVDEILGSDGITYESVCADDTIFYEDNDGDGSGGTETTVDTGVTVGGDCDDSDATAFPGNPEVCDGVDNDCDGTIDNLSSGTCTVYEDGDGDGYGDEVSTDGTGVTTDGDCDDADSTINPGATEVCDNSVDEDCSGTADVCVIYYDDVDGDGYGDDSTAHTTADSDDVVVGGDCDDRNLNINPGATEICEDATTGNGTDENCDGIVDDSCAIEICTDGFDNDSNGLQDCDDTEACDCSDSDGDGYTVADGDCNDSNTEIHPGAAEICNFANIDYDCDGVVNDDNICINGAEGTLTNMGEGFVQADGGALFNGCSLQENTLNQNGSNLWILLSGLGLFLLTLRKRVVL